MRRPLLLLAVAIAASACGGHEHEAAAPPPIAASKPAPEPSSPPPATAQPAAEGKASPATAPAPPPKTSPPPAPDHTLGTEIPGSIPPATLPPDPTPKPAEVPADALQWLRDSEARKADHERRVREAQETVDAAATDVARWKDVLLAFKNPFRPRPQLTQDEADAIAGMDGGARVHWAEGRVAGAQAALDAATKKLADLKANPPLN